MHIRNRRVLDDCVYLKEQLLLFSFFPILLSPILLFPVLHLLSLISHLSPVCSGNIILSVYLPQDLSSIPLDCWNHRNNTPQKQSIQAKFKYFWETFYLKLGIKTLLKLTETLPRGYYTKFFFPFNAKNHNNLVRLSPKENKNNIVYRIHFYLFSCFSRMKG